jgi:uncharacterized DUF497 family protein
MRFDFDAQKSKQLRANPKRGIGFDEAQEIFKHPYYVDQRSDIPEQYRAIGWVGEKLYALIFEVREDNDGEYYHLVTLWKATTQEQQLYEEHSKTEKGYIGREHCPPRRPGKGRLALFHKLRANDGPNTAGQC